MTATIIGAMIGTIFVACVNIRSLSDEPDLFLPEDAQKAEGCFVFIAEKSMSETKDINLYGKIGDRKP